MEGVFKSARLVTIQYLIALQMYPVGVLFGFGISRTLAVGPQR
jgi:hypothetical protein